ncbi:MAG: M23 family metallopeptidase [Solirubrobacteraceae bacterium]|nr:M23 family metallopeptidase [Solirubrobacteraceae bacterium]
MSCVTGCTSARDARFGSVLRIRGRTMGSVARIVFLGGKGNGDNVTTRALVARSSSVDVAVPERAVSGRLRAINANGKRSSASRATVSVRRTARASGPLDVAVVERRVFYGGAQPARVDLLAREAMSVAIVLVRLTDGAVVTGWPVALVPGIISSVTWDGRAAGAAQPPGRYAFHVIAGAGVPGAQPPAPLGTVALDLVDHAFPVRGRHTYGGSAARFGAGRGGRRHQGHDVFARCGTPVVAARGGVVKVSRFEARAGHYVVIAGEHTEIDYVYMHMRARSPLRTGARVRTGQRIGAVGDTGHAHGCHLHFEMWSSPGWHSGGQPVDPLPFLRAWAAYS